MARMLATADASLAGICDFVILGIVNAAIIRIMVTTISSSLRVKPRSRLLLHILFTSLVSLQRLSPQDTVFRFGMGEKAGVMREADKENYSSLGHQCQRSPVGWTH